MCALDDRYSPRRALLGGQPQLRARLGGPPEQQQRPTRPYSPALRCAGDEVIARAAAISGGRVGARRRHECASTLYTGYSMRRTEGRGQASSACAPQHSCAKRPGCTLCLARRRRSEPDAGNHVGRRAPVSASGTAIRRCAARKARPPQSPIKLALCCPCRCIRPGSAPADRCYLSRGRLMRSSQLETHACAYAQSESTPSPPGQSPPPQARIILSAPIS